jgi:hypothetical protein
LARNLGWLHNRVAAWSEKYIVAAILASGTNRDAALAGLLANPRVDDERLYVVLKPLLLELGANEGQSQRIDRWALGSLFARGWLMRNADGKRWLSDDEFRRVLIYGGDDLRTQVLRLVRGFEYFEEKKTFLKEVWPIQLTVRTPLMVGGLCALAFDDETHFPALVDVVLPLVAHADGAVGRLSLSLVENKKRSILKQYPDQAFTLLAVVLPADAKCWPHGVDKMLELLIQAKPALSKDPRMIRLKGIWDRR